MEEYPNLTNEALPAILPCARWEIEIINYATNAFQRICPVGFVVENVRPLPCSKKPYCQWYVEFRTENYILLPPPGEELKMYSKKLMKYKPLNSKFVTRHSVSAFAIAIIYSCDPCPCVQPLVFDEATSTPEMRPTKIKGSNEFNLDICNLFQSTA